MASRHASGLTRPVGDHGNIFLNNVEEFLQRAESVFAYQASGLSISLRRMDMVTLQDNQHHVIDRTLAPDRPGGLQIAPKACPMQCGFFASSFQLNMQLINCSYPFGRIIIHQHTPLAFWETQ